MKLSKMATSCGKIFVKKYDLNLKLMLEGGQSFRWKSTNKENEWLGVFKGIVWRLTQFDDHVSFTAHLSSSSDRKKRSKLSAKASSDGVQDKSLERMLSDYLRVDSPLDEYYSTWSEQDDNFKKAAQTFHGLRLLDQDPVENLFSFICSSNNNITRISMMVERMCELYGEEICSVDGTSFHSFPAVESLSQPSVEGALRTAGFGYRAKFISASALKLSKLGGSKYLDTLKKLSYDEAKQQLIQFPGIGPKVADCICLMSLGQFEAVPVDTHVFQVASQSYLPHLKAVKSVTDRVYREIGDHFRQLYGPLAGWAHTILFCADLKKFQSTESQRLVVGGDEKRKKAAKRKLNVDGESQCKREWKELSEDVGQVQSDEDSGKTDVVVVEGELPIPQRDLHLRVTFNCGQTYRWREVEEGVWRGVHADRVWTLDHRQDALRFVCHCNPTALLDTQSRLTNNKEDERKRCVELLSDYFRLSEPLSEMYEEWSTKDSRFRDVCRQLYGLRMTRQDVVENLFAFICSSNNTISRISSMVRHLCRTYGDHICELDGEDYFTAARLERLSCDGVADGLKGAGFGFRSSYVEKAAKTIRSKGGSDWFNRLISSSYVDAKNMLMELPGIGAKVADCICLTALDHLEAIPVDTHVFQMAKKYYLPHLKADKSVTKRAYSQIGSHFRQLFGRHAGWAHTVLFCSELRLSADLLQH